MRQTARRGDLGVSSGARTGTSVMTTPGSRRRRSLSENSVGGGAPLRSERLRKSSGMTSGHEGRLAARERPQVLDHRVEPPVLRGTISRSGRRAVSCRKRGTDAGIAVPARGRGSPGSRQGRSRRAYQSASSARRRTTRRRGRPVRRRRSRRDSRHASAKTPRDLPVVPAARRRSTTTSNGMATMTAQAPSANFDSITRIATSPVATAPRRSRPRATASPAARAAASSAPSPSARS